MSTSRAWAEAAYARDGFLVLSSLLDGAELAAITRNASDLCRGRLGHRHRPQHGSDSLPESELLKRYLASHHPHKLSPAMRALMSRAPR